MDLPNTGDALEAGLQALATFLVDKLPQLDGLITVGAAAWEDEREPPFLAIIPDGFPRLDSFIGGEDVVDDSRARSTGAGGILIQQVGEWVGTVDLVLATPTPADRASLGSAILQILLGQADEDSDRHGVGVFPLGVQVLLDDVWTTVAGGSTASFWLTSGSWAEEAAFTRDRRAILRLEASIGILAVRRIPGTQDDVRIAYTPDLDSPAATVPTSSLVVTESGDLVNP